MNAYGVVLESGAVRFERLLPGPIERVWSYLAESEKRGRWLASGAFDLRVGGRTEMLFKHSDITEETPPDAYREVHENGVHSTGTITRCEPPRIIAFTWGGGGEPESEVEFELVPKGEKVLLVLTHRKLTSKAKMTSVSGGWHMHLDLLEDQLAGSKPRGFWSRFKALHADYAARYANLPEPGQG
ncbi:MAG: SRPBCC family protein [Hyphomicrobiales bacterium]|nr:MAG: SRPBCC family protein [Hyphomicrobiales bacterium]